ncbi:hypothetical protein Tco_1302291 [Tanacetum coccineum]
MSSNDDFTELESCGDDGVLGRLKFVSKGEDYQVYGIAIPDTMLIDEITNSEHYQTFLALSTDLIPLKKSRGKGSKGKKAAVTPKKKSSITADDNIIPKPNVAFELGKSPTSVEQSDESDGESANRPTGRRRPTGVVFKDTSNISKNKSLDASQKLKGVQVPDKSTCIFTTSSEGAGIVPEVPDEAKGSYAPKVDAAIDCWFGGKLWKLLKEEACLTTIFNNFLMVQVKDLVLFQRFPMSQRTILVAQATHFLNPMMKFKTSSVMRKTKLKKTKLMQKLQRNKPEMNNQFNSVIY